MMRLQKQRQGGDCAIRTRDDSAKRKCEWPRHRVHASFATVRVRGGRDDGELHGHDGEVRGDDDEGS